MASAASYSNLVQELYVAYFGRPADYFGLQNFETALAAANAPTDIAGLEAAYSTNAAVKSLVDSFGTSHESNTLYGSLTGAGAVSTESFVNAIFENLLNRAPAVAGLTFWVNAINSGQVTPGDAALAIAAGAAANTSAQGVIDATTIANKIAVASNFTTDLGGNSESIVAYSGAGAATSARALLAGVTNTTVAATYESTVQSTITSIVNAHIDNSYVLTTGVDTIVGGPGNNAFSAVLDNTAGLAAGGEAATLNSFDSITGGTLVNTLNITDFGTGSWMSIPSGATISGITTLNISSLEGVAGNTSPGFNVSSALDVSGWTNLTAFNINSSNNYYNIVKVGDNTAVAITTSGTSSEYVLTFGGTTVNINNSSAEYTYNYLTGGKATTSITVSGISENYVYDQHNSFNEGYDGGGTTPGWSTGTNTIATYSASKEDDGSYNYIYSDALTTLNLTDSSYTYTYVSAATGTRSLAVNLSNDGNSKAYPGEEFYVQDNSATSVVVTASGTATKGFSLDAQAATALTFNDTVGVTFYDGTIAGSKYLYAPAAKAVTVTGAGAFTSDLSGLNAAAVFDASGSTGVVTVELASAAAKGALTQSFIGGSGQDIVTVGAGQTGSVAAGTAANNEIILANAPGATEAALASYTNFSTLGIAGSTSGIFTMGGKGATGYTSFDIQGAGGDVTFAGVSSGNSLSIDGNDAHNVVWQTATGAGATESANVTLGSGTSNITILGLTLEDSAHNGTGTVNLVTNQTDTYITTFKDVNLTTLNISGAGSVSVSNVMNDVSKTLTINNTSSATSTESYFAGFSDNNLTTLTLNGSASTDVNTVNGTGTSLTVVDNDTAAVWVDTIGDTALTSLTLTNSVNSKAATFVVTNTVMEAGLATLNLNGNVQITVTGDAVTSGITVTGGTDNATVHFTSTGVTAAKAVDSVTLGNGAGDSVVLGAGAAGSTQTIVLGNGAGDSITTTSVGTVNATVGSAATGTDSITANSAATVHITAGNGTNVISATAATSTTIVAGTGTNTIATGAAAVGTITVGTHAATVVDGITLGASGVAGAAETITGLNNVGLDTITFADAASVVAGGVQNITEAQVLAAGGDPTQLASWIAAATGADVAAGAPTMTAHGINWFTFHNTTYLVETAGVDTGALTASDTVVELTGTNYTFAKATATGGVFHLLG